MAEFGHARQCTQGPLPESSGGALSRAAEEKGQPFVGLAGVTETHLAPLTLTEELVMLKKMS